MGTPILDEKTKALFEAGFFNRNDLVALVLFLGGTGTTGFWMIFGHPEPYRLVLAAIACLYVLLLWCIMVCYRASWFALQTLAEMKLLPASAAKLALRFASQSSGAAEDGPA